MRLNYAIAYDRIKTHTLANLDTYLEAFEQNALKRGIKVHWAKDASEHNDIVLDILRSNNVKMVVKSKSMLTEECHLNPHLEKHGIEVVDTDLGELLFNYAMNHSLISSSQQFILKKKM